MDPAKRAELSRAYNAFVAGVNSGADDLESLGDALADVYMVSRVE
jgi:hypothetical protein